MNKTEKDRRDFLVKTVAAGLAFGLGNEASAMFASAPKTIRVGIIGLSVHSADFTEIMNSGQNDPLFAGCKVVALHHPKGNADVEFSPEQLSQFTNTVKKNGVELVSSTAELLKKSDAIMLLTNDGRPHQEQILPVLKVGKPVFVDKPMAESLPNVIALFDLAQKYKTPIFSCSPLRYVRDMNGLAGGKIAGEILGADAYGPAPLQKSHADLFWDGIHAIELLYAVMGPGCQSVTRAYSEGADVVTGVWKGGKIGVFRGLRKGKIGFGGTAYGSEKITAIGKFDGYGNLVAEIVTFFRTGQPPVAAAETIEIYTFMEAAHESKRRGGAPVALSDILAKTKG
ncbi:Gfo/Idh/MocA family oxidoreductase [Dyadobacter sp. CY327]|uniref:Gfo/Idh/MocA family protein n=1 Tax=Dyadobacter sp. CY327 TaxID=2907301 RepID=UPI001F356FA1|nr:Gfo/Idh/MocA family oxidoreductase [Dyadobacter sp. CY327]MCE7070823.1 Gfo/Idh/MocA family oxidoreductase [Dyadobacter sp. CY327]